MPAQPSVVKPPRRKLCGGALGAPEKKLPTAEIDRAQAAGEAPLPEALAAGGGKWTWLNFWAAWCVPCKEEIPRLRSWEKRLAEDGVSFRLTFVSLDDDERQLQDFLKGAGDGGVRRTYWLREGKQRTEWLEGAGMQADPELPAHLLIDPQGHVRCTVDGAVEDADYAELLGLLRG